MKKTGLLLIFLFIACNLTPINAQEITENQLIGTSSAVAHNSSLFVFSQGTTIAHAVSEVTQGETAHMTVKLVCYDDPNVSVANQVVSIRLYDVDGIEIHLNTPYVVTSNNGEADLAINTFALKPGCYGITAYYAGNINDKNVDNANKLNSSRCLNGPGLWVNPQDFRDPYK